VGTIGSKFAYQRAFGGTPTAKAPAVGTIEFKYKGVYQTYQTVPALQVQGFAQRLKPPKDTEASDLYGKENKITKLRIKIKRFILLFIN
jgi:hypothetical protein